MEPHQGAAYDQTGGMDAVRWIGEQRRQLREGNGREHGTEKYQGTEPHGQHDIDERVEEGTHDRGLHGMGRRQHLLCHGWRSPSWRVTPCARAVVVELFDKRQGKLFNART